MKKLFNKKVNGIKRFRTRIRKGITFYEMIIVVAIIGILAAVGVKLFSALPSMLSTGQTEFDIQSSVKAASETIVNKVRYSTAVFILPERSFTPAKLTDGWDYIGVENVTLNDSDRKEIVQYSWNGKNHDRSVLVEAQNDLIYDLKFSSAESDYANDQLIYLRFEAVAADTESDGRSMKVDTSADALNSLQVVDHSTKSDVGRAIAYSTSSREYAIDDGIAPGRVSMVLDVSGSMKDPFSEGKTRIEALRSVTSSLLEQFYNSGSDFEVNFIPFATEANDTRSKYTDGESSHKFKSVRNDIDMQQELVRSLTASGWTNTGDGIRRSYHSLLKAENNDTRPIPNYVILVVDGDSTHYTRKYNQFYYEDGNAYSRGYSRPIYVGSVSDANQYVKAISQHLVNNLTVRPMVSELRCFLVAVQMDQSAKGLMTIKNALNIADDDYLIANNAIDMQGAFEYITNEVIQDAWFIYGPQL